MNTPTWPQVGIHPGIDPEIYFAPQKGAISERMISKSLLWDFDKNPNRWLLSPEREVTESMKWGSLVDCLSLTPERFKDSYRVQPSTYQSPASAKKDAPMIEKPWNWNSNTCKAWRDDLPAGIECISEYQMREAEKASKILCERSEFAEMMAGAQTQVGMRFDFRSHFPSGAMCHGIDGFTAPAKGLIDIAPDIQGKWGRYLVDLKTTGKLDDMDQVERSIYNFGYHAQAALYLDIWNALTGEGRKGFMFAFQLSSAPYEVAIVELSVDAILQAVSGISPQSRNGRESSRLETGKALGME